ARVATDRRSCFHTASTESRHPTSAAHLPLLRTPVVGQIHSRMTAAPPVTGHSEWSLPPPTKGSDAPGVQRKLQRPINWRYSPVAVGGHREPALAERSVGASSPLPTSVSSSAGHPTAKQAAPCLTLAAGRHAGLALAGRS